MNLLLDTHTILWFLANAPNLSARARAAILDPANVRWASPISLLEIALKNRIGKLPLPDPFGVMFASSLTASDIHLLPLEPQHIEPLTRLPMHPRTLSTASSPRPSWSRAWPWSPPTRPSTPTA